MFYAEIHDCSPRWKMENSMVITSHHYNLVLSTKRHTKTPEVDNGLKNRSPPWAMLLSVILYYQNRKNEPF